MNSIYIITDLLNEVFFQFCGEFNIQSAVKPPPRPPLGSLRLPIFFLFFEFFMTNTFKWRWPDKFWPLKLYSSCLYNLSLPRLVHEGSLGFMDGQISEGSWARCCFIAEWSVVSFRTFIPSSAAANLRSNDVMTATKRSLKKWICVFSVFVNRIYSYPLTLSNVGDPSWSWIQKDHIQIQKEK